MLGWFFGQNGRCGIFKGFGISTNILRVAAISCIFVHENDMVISRDWYRILPQLFKIINIYCFVLTYIIFIISNKWNWLVATVSYLSHIIIIMVIAINHHRNHRYHNDCDYYCHNHFFMLTILSFKNRASSPALSLSLSTSSNQ